VARQRREGGVRGALVGGQRQVDVELGVEVVRPQHAQRLRLHPLQEPEQRAGALVGAAGGGGWRHLGRRAETGKQAGEDEEQEEDVVGLQLQQEPRPSHPPRFFFKEAASWGRRRRWWGYWLPTWGGWR